MPVLTDALFTNAAVFINKPYAKTLSNVVPLTLHQGTSFANIHEDPEFEQFKDSPYVYRQAAATNADPRGFLRDVIAGEHTDLNHIGTEPDQEIFEPA